MKKNNKIIWAMKNNINLDRILNRFLGVFQ
jgi:hypothetical protein